MMDPMQLIDYERRLRELRLVLTDLESSRREASAVVELDQARTGRLSRMDALQLQAMANAGRERAAVELRRIDAALERIRTGRYGYCVECGEIIAPARLASQPAIALCVDCAHARERR
jgi:DnaK suppressor protein